MKLMKTLLFSLPMLLLPLASSAGLPIIGGLFDDTAPPAPSVPEPSGALVMGVALVVVLVAGRRLRR